jgi:hypothetical protein
MSKEKLLLDKVITTYHPVFHTNNELRKAALQNPEMFNTSMLVEYALAFASQGMYTVTGGAHSDFSDGTEAKTGSIRRNGPSGWSGEISGVSRAGRLKSGALRCVIYNSYKNELMYYFLPKEFWMNLVNTHSTNKMGRIQFSYNRYYDSIPKLDYGNNRCSSFVDLATRT